jgi:UDP-N-acetylglucosamine 2-epimerase (non-hydrolysing)
MKIKPVMDSLEGRGVDVLLVHTGQHYDQSMSTIFFEELDIRRPDRWLEVGSGSHAEQTARVMIALEPVVSETSPDVIVVVGDVNSTMAAAVVAAKSTARLAHVEAGLRSRDWSMPEEVNRLVTDSVCDDLFAPSADAVDNLLHEGHPLDRIHLVGNVMIDTLYANLDRASSRPVLDNLKLSPMEYGLVTLHCPANVDDPAVLEGLVRALGTVGPLSANSASTSAAGGSLVGDFRAIGAPGHRAARVSRLHRSPGWCQDCAHGLGGSAGGNDGLGRPVLDLARYDGAPNHDC